MHGEAIPLRSKRLRLERGDGAPVREYSIESGHVEVRTLDNSENHVHAEATTEWQPVTPEELKSHVEHRTVVAEWLKRRFGWRRLLRECVS